MIRLILKILRIASVLALPIAGVLKEQGAITQPQFLWALVVLFVYLLISAIFDVLPTKKTPSEMHKLVPTVDTLLKSLIKEYEYQLKIHNLTDGGQIRANVMLIHNGFIGRYMKMRFFSTQSPSVKYDQSELNIKWKKKQGGVGLVWREQTQKLLCSTDNDWQKISTTLSRKQKNAAGFVNSIISEPIFNSKEKKIIAILSLDSILEVTESYFDKQFVVDLLRKYAGIVRPVCPDGGISFIGK